MEPVADRFCRYVRIDTRSNEQSITSPSTPGQLDLLRLLRDELIGLGLTDVELSEHGVLTATLGSNLPPALAEGVPTVGFIAHVDTHPGVSGTNVKPIRHHYRGGDIVLPGDPEQVIAVSECQELLNYIEKEIITSDGTTLLGADDKAGVAEIMAALEYWVTHPTHLHGRIRVAFTPDEEIGRGADHFDVEAFGARCAYTMDGSVPGEVENESFCADTAIFTVTGRDHHPGFAKGLLVNALLVAADLLSRLPRDAAPEATEGRQGYLHAYEANGNVGEATVRVLVRDFTEEGLASLEARLELIRKEVSSLHPRAHVGLEIVPSYRNMKLKLDETPEVAAHALEAVRRAGLSPKLTAIRGGTDGSRLTLLGLPTPNIFAGGMNFHSKREWVAVSAMAQAVETIVHLGDVWREWGEARRG